MAVNAGDAVSDGVLMPVNPCFRRVLVGRQ